MSYPGLRFRWQVRWEAPWSGDGAGPWVGAYVTDPYAGHTSTPGLVPWGSHALAALASWDGAQLVVEFPQNTYQGPAPTQTVTLPWPAREVVLEWRWQTCVSGAQGSGEPPWELWVDGVRLGVVRDQTFWRMTPWDACFAAVFCAEPTYPSGTRFGYRLVGVDGFDHDFDQVDPDPSTWRSANPWNTGAMWAPTVPGGQQWFTPLVGIRPPVRLCAVAPADELLLYVPDVHGLQAAEPTYYVRGGSDYYLPQFAFDRYDADSVCAGRLLPVTHEGGVQPERARLPVGWMYGADFDGGLVERRGLLTAHGSYEDTYPFQRSRDQGHTWQPWSATAPDTATCVAPTRYGQWLTAAAGCGSPVYPSSGAGAVVVGVGGDEHAYQVWHVSTVKAGVVPTPRAGAPYCWPYVYERPDGAWECGWWYAGVVEVWVSPDLGATWTQSSCVESSRTNLAGVSHLSGDHDTQVAACYDYDGDELCVAWKAKPTDSWSDWLPVATLPSACWPALHMWPSGDWSLFAWHRRQVKEWRAGHPSADWTEVVR